MNMEIVSAIKRKLVLQFVYDGEERVVEPQTYGISKTGKEILRARQIGGGSCSGQLRIAKLFDAEKISALRKLSGHFTEALPEHNPSDSAMTEVFVSLPPHKRK
jgi:hypothetical protein